MSKQSKPKPAPRNLGGRPRNKALDAIQKEMAVTRRRAATILIEAGSENPSKLSPVAAARLRKLNLEAERLTAQVRAIKIEAALHERTLLTTEEGIRLMTAPGVVIKQMIDTMPRTLALRLYNQSPKAIEDILASWGNSVLRAAHAAVSRVKSDLGEGVEINSVL